MLCVELDGRIALVNAQAERLFGYRRDELVGQLVEVLFPQAERERETQMLAAVVRGERIDEHQTHHVRNDGSLIAVSLTLSPITDAAGRITGISTVARDLTERQRAEARFVGLLEAAPDAMVCVGRDGRIALVRAEGERRVGYGREELVGQAVE